MKKMTLVVGCLATLLALPAAGGSVNKSVKIDAGSTSSGASSVNGSVSVGENAIVSGSVSTVNGKVRVDAGASVKDASTVNGSLRIAEGVNSNNLSTVNGSIKVGSSATIGGDVEAVNGSIHVDQGTSVARDVSNVNGRIGLHGAEVAGNVSTVSGDIDVVDGSVVKGNVVVKKPSSWGRRNKSKDPTVTIGPGSTVEGTIRLERTVKLYVSETASVGSVSGVMSMDDAIRFSGNNP